MGSLSRQVFLMQAAIVRTKNAILMLLVLDCRRECDFRHGILLMVVCLDVQFKSGFRWQNSPQ